MSEAKVSEVQPTELRALLDSWISNIGPSQESCEMQQKTS